MNLTIAGVPLCARLVVALTFSMMPHIHQYPIHEHAVTYCVYARIQVTSTNDCMCVCVRVRCHIITTADA